MWCDKGNPEGADRRVPLPILPILCLVLALTLVCGTSEAGQAAFRDDVGREVSFSYPPKRIISLAPNITEILFALGLDEEIVGVSLHCNYPDKAKARPRVGSYINLDYERILSLKPDLVVATGAGNTKEMVERLGRLGFPVYVLFPKQFDDILRSIRDLGRAIQRDREAAALAEAMRTRKERVARLVAGLPRPRVFLQIGEAPIVTVGRGSFADDLIRIAGGENVAGAEKNAYPRYSMEEILRRSPEVILISSMNPQGDYEKVRREWARWPMVPAVRDRRVHVMDSDLLDRPAPRIVDGLEELARLLHPERFKTGR
jgi:iron complex transport system substrate-binding protein